MAAIATYSHESESYNQNDRTRLEEDVSLCLYLK